jgi:hypothetical protein
MSAFFGLGPSYRPILHKEICSLVYYGGGYTWADVWEFPIWLRRFYIQTINSFKKEEAEAYKAAQNNTDKKPPKFPNIPKGK